MPKREGFVYEKMADWTSIIAAENIVTDRKLKRRHVQQHISHRFRNLTEIQQMVIDETIETGEYHHEQKVSGQEKLRDIAKLYFHPNHIYHELLCFVARERIDKYLIPHTYASRIGYGQTACAQQIKKNLKKYIGQQRWIGQGDIVKYYDNINHNLVRESLKPLFKDQKYIDAFVEPFEKYSAEGVKIPLGITVSQPTGNIVLAKFDRFMTEDVKAKDYVRYLDDFVFSGGSKGEVKWKMKRARKLLEKDGFRLHEPKIQLLSEGVNMMGYWYYGRKDDMWWRKMDKVRWLKRRNGVTNTRRLREIDASAWGMIKHGNRSCKKLFRKVSNFIFKGMGVSLNKTNIQRSERLDQNGVPFIDAVKISMSMLLGKPVVIDKWIPNVKTSQGSGRYALRVQFMDNAYKLIVNAVEIKSFLADLTKAHVTKVRTTFIDRGGMKYGVDEKSTEILEVNGCAIAESEGKIVYADTSEEVVFGEDRN